MNRNCNHDDAAKNKVDSDKENQELDNLVVDAQADDTEQEEEEERKLRRSSTGSVDCWKQFNFIQKYLT